MERSWRPSSKAVRRLGFAAMWLAAPLAAMPAGAADQPLAMDHGTFLLATYCTGAFAARADHLPLRVNEEEVESARWFTRAELRASPENETFKLPRPDSIARRLVNDWLAEG